MDGDVPVGIRTTSSTTAVPSPLTEIMLPPRPVTRLFPDVDVVFDARMEMPLRYVVTHAALVWIETRRWL